MPHFTEILTGTGHRDGAGPKTTGWVSVDADAITAIGGRIVNARPAEGISELQHGDEVIDVQVGPDVVLRGAILHRSGARERDLTTAVLRLNILQAAALSDAHQSAFLLHRLVPPGLNPQNPGRFPGVETPMKPRAAETGGVQ